MGKIHSEQNMNVLNRNKTSMTDFSCYLKMAWHCTVADPVFI